MGILGTCFNIFKCFIGIGLLALPSAFSEVRFFHSHISSLKIGVIGGSLIILLIGVLNYYTMMLQINCKLKLGGTVETYSDLAMKAYGPWGKFIVDFCLYTSQLGACIAYLLFVGKQFD